MREIKFRVFDKQEKVMHIVGDDPHDSFFVGLKNELTYYNLQNGEGSGEEGDYILMQYTGFTDSGGKEIYEGDVMRGYFEYEDVGGEIFNLTAVGKVYFNETKGTWELEEKGGATDGLADWINSGNAKVIGNIFENPEILEKAI